MGFPKTEVHNCFQTSCHALVSEWHTVLEARIPKMLERVRTEIKYGCFEFKLNFNLI